MKTFKQSSFSVAPASTAKGIAEVLFFNELDQLPYAEVTWINLEKGKGSPPKSIELKLDSAPLFKGELFQTQNLGPSKLKLLFLDANHKPLFSRKMQLFLQLPLRSLLQELAKPIRTDFIGDFSLTVSEFCMDGYSVFENLNRLAADFGFFIDFQHDKVVFIQVGKHSGKGEFPKEASRSIQFSTRQGTPAQTAQIVFFNSHNAQIQKHALSNQELYNALKDFKNTKALAPWTSGAEIRLSSKSQFEEAKKKIPFQFSRKSLMAHTIQYKTRNTFAPLSTCLLVKEGSEVIQSFTAKNKFQFRGSVCFVESEGFYA